jgi:hypothetical protein
MPRRCCALMRFDQRQTKGLGLHRRRFDVNNECKADNLANNHGVGACSTRTDAQCTGFAKSTLKICCSSMLNWANDMICQNVVHRCFVCTTDGMQQRQRLSQGRSFLDALFACLQHLHCCSGLRHRQSGVFKIMIADFLWLSVGAALGTTVQARQAPRHSVSTSRSSVLLPHPSLPRPIPPPPAKLEHPSVPVHSGCKANRNHAGGPVVGVGRVAGIELCD